MKKLKRWCRNNLSALSIALSVCAVAWSQSSSADGQLTLSKNIFGATGGVGLQGANFSTNFCWGEPAAGQQLSFAGGTLNSGYYGGRFGAGQSFTVLSSSMIGSPAYFQNGLQIGVTVNAVARITFSDGLDLATVSNALHVYIRQDHLANSQNTLIPSSWTYDTAENALYVYPTPIWAGNTLYQIEVTPELRSQNDYVLSASTGAVFLTMADPHEENIIVDANHLSMSPGLNASSQSAESSALRVEMSPESLADYSVFLFNTDPLNTPWRADPEMIREANRKAQVDGGGYQVPVALLEVAAYNPAGQRLQNLSRSAEISVGYQAGQGWVSGTPAPVHDSSLALWALDTEHQRWVKIPESQQAGQAVHAPITRLSVFALMGSASGITSDSYVFPNPWRPHGPNAGTGTGQSGTELSGMTFSGLPSECSIKIYTLNGEQVRELHHSDTAGPVAQQVWDGKTGGGHTAASGVYLWRVESAQDGKNGKLMIIR
jgi:hypothetical protein